MIYHDRPTHLGKKATFGGRPVARLFLLVGGVFFAYMVGITLHIGAHTSLKASLILGLVSMLPFIALFARPVSDDPLNERLLYLIRARRRPRHYISLPDPDGWKKFMHELGFSIAEKPVKHEDGWLDE